MTSFDPMSARYGSRPLSNTRIPNDVSLNRPVLAGEHDGPDVLGT